MGETDDIKFTAAVMDGHVAAFAIIVTVGEELGHEVFEGEAPLLKNACFAVLGEYDVFWGEGGRGANRDTFFAS